MKYHFNDFSKIINTVEKRKEYFYYGDNYDLFTIDKFHEHCGTFHIPHLQSPNRDQWIYNQLLSILTPDEYKYFFNINTNTIDDYKKIIPYVEYLTQKISSIMSENTMIEENPDYIQTDEET